MKASRKRSALRSIAQVVIGIAALAYVLSRVDRRQAIEALAGAHVSPLVLAFLLTALSMVGITAWRWQQLIVAQGVSIPLSRLAAIYLVGYFFNMLLPGAIGGDLYRIIKLGDAARQHQGEREWEVATASVVSERLLGLAALLPIGAIGFALTERRWVGQIEFLVVMTVFTLAVLSLPLWLRPSVLRATRPLYQWAFSVPLVQKLRLQERAERLYRAVSGYLERPGVLLVAFAASLASRLTWILAALLTGRALGVNLSYGAYMAVLAITELVRMVPISLGGIGMREGTFVVLLAPLGISGGTAFTLSFLFYLMLMLLGLVGGGLYLLFGLRPDRQTTPDEQRSGEGC